MYQIPEPLTLYERASTYLFHLENSKKADILLMAGEIELQALVSAALSMELCEICSEINTALNKLVEK